MREATGRRWWCGCPVGFGRRRKEGDLVARGVVVEVRRKGWRRFAVFAASGEERERRWRGRSAQVLFSLVVVKEGGAATACCIFRSKGSTGGGEGEVLFGGWSGV
ncbi:hypothetical protein HAX54_026039 [Datura stramonium]|uniref:Uncharacterized protein n=1 Tax=Datura stramonium TaxID=4076 RepID=A0ABS8V2Q9_DATST|nr:hypothetical protein [Datura stramonium]